jgi:hypothetical protein
MFGASQFSCQLAVGLRDVVQQQLIVPPCATIARVTRSLPTFTPCTLAPLQAAWQGGMCSNGSASMRSP